MSERLFDWSDSRQSGRRRLGRRRRAAEDVDYAPDELAFTKTDYFKVEKAMNVFGLVCC